MEVRRAPTRLAERRSRFFSPQRTTKRSLQVDEMSTVPADAPAILGLESAGLLMTADEFDAITEYDENYRYELIHGVLVVNPIPNPEETGPNELLGHLLWEHQQQNAGSTFDESLPQQYVRT